MKTAFMILAAILLCSVALPMASGQGGAFLNEFPRANDTYFFNQVSGVTVDSTGLIYVADQLGVEANAGVNSTAYGRLVVLANNGSLINIFPRSSDTYNFSSVTGVAVDTANHILYVADNQSPEANAPANTTTSLGRIVVLSSNGAFVNAFPRSTDSYHFDGAASVTLYGSNLYVADASSPEANAGPNSTAAGRVVIISTNGTLINIFPRPTDNYNFSAVVAVAVGTLNTNLYVADTGNVANLFITNDDVGRVVVLSSSGSLINTFPRPSDSYAFYLVTGLTLDSATNNIYVADFLSFGDNGGNGHITILSMNGDLLSVFPSDSDSYMFLGIEGIALDSALNMYVGDAVDGEANGLGYGRVVVLSSFIAPSSSSSSSSTASMIASSSPSSSTSSAGTFLNAFPRANDSYSFTQVNGVTVDSAGLIYVADQLGVEANAGVNSTASGRVVVLANSGSLINIFPRSSDAYKFNSVTGVAVDTVNQILYVADGKSPEANAPSNTTTSLGRMVVLSSNGAFVNAYPRSTDAYHFDNINSVTLHGSNLYVADYYSPEANAGLNSTAAGRVVIISTNGTLINIFPRPTDNYNFSNVAEVVVGTLNTNLYVADTGYPQNPAAHAIGRVVVLSSSGSLISTFPRPSDSYAFYVVTGLTLDSANNIYVSDLESHEANGGPGPAFGHITILSMNGDLLSVFPRASDSYTFFLVSGIALDSASNMYVCDFLGAEANRVLGSNGRVVVLSPFFVPPSSSSSSSTARMIASSSTGLGINSATSSWSANSLRFIFCTTVLLVALVA